MATESKVSVTESETSKVAEANGSIFESEVNEDTAFFTLKLLAPLKYPKKISESSFNSATESCGLELSSSTFNFSSVPVCEAELTKGSGKITGNSPAA